jgi:hypothetical protein
MERLRRVSDKATEIRSMCLEHGLRQVVVEGLRDIVLCGLGVVPFVVDADLEKFETV